jgi:hypothetical protein
MSTPVKADKKKDNATARATPPPPASSSGRRWRRDLRRSPLLMLRLRALLIPLFRAFPGCGQSRFSAQITINPLLRFRATAKLEQAFESATLT